MFPIVKKRVLNETVTLMEIEAPLVARKALPGQFIIFRIDEEGERIPLTIAGYDREKGTVTIIFQKVGYTTMKLDTLNEEPYRGRQARGGYRRRSGRGDCLSAGEGAARGGLRGGLDCRLPQRTPHHPEG